MNAIFQITKMYQYKIYDKLYFVRFEQTEKMCIGINQDEFQRCDERVYISQVT